MAGQNVIRYLADSKIRTPPINWWHGRLRPYESWLSFCINFRKLNSISQKSFNDYLAFTGCTFNSEDEFLAHLATSIGENLPTLKMSYQAFRRFGYSTFTLKQPASLGKELRYCPMCIASGYHSFLHNLDWLFLCPFHLIPLKMKSCGEKQYETFEALCGKFCPQWPFVRSEDPYLSSSEKSGYAKLLLAWWDAASSKQIALNHAQIRSHLSWDAWKKEGLEYKLGKLCTLEKLPDLLLPLLIPHPYVTLCSKTFSRKTSAHIIKVISKSHLYDFYELYKVIANHSNQPTELSKLVLNYRKKIQKLHYGVCSWSYRPVGWYWHWYSILDPYECRNCPNIVAQNDLDIIWGKREEKISARKVTDHAFSFNYWARNSLSLNVYQLKAGYERWVASPIEALSAYEWIDSTLATLFDLLAKYELEVFFARTQYRLRLVNDGGKPFDTNWPEGGVHIIFTNQRFTIIKWQQQEVVGRRVGR